MTRNSTPSGIGNSSLPRAIHGRHRGFIDNWCPRPRTLALLDRVQSVLAEYREHLPLTVRQIYYRLVAIHGYHKTHRAYQNLCELLSKARRARVIPFDSIRDDAFDDDQHVGWDSAEACFESFVRTVHAFRLDRQQGQPRRLVVWCEAQGMAPQLRQVAAQYSVPVYSSGGFDHTGPKHKMARTWAGMRSVKVLHVGDHDVSGVHVYGSLDEDVCKFNAAYGGEVEFERLAVLPEHIKRFKLPTAPPKLNDRRIFLGDTVQAEALAPDVMAQILDEAIKENLDMARYAGALIIEQQQRDALLARLRGLG